MTTKPINQMDVSHLPSERTRKRAHPLYHKSMFKKTEDLSSITNDYDSDIVIKSST